MNSKQKQALKKRIVKDLLGIIKSEKMFTKNDPWVKKITKDFKDLRKAMKFKKMEVKLTNGKK